MHILSPLYEVWVSAISSSSFSTHNAYLKYNYCFFLIISYKRTGNVAALLQSRVSRSILTLQSGIAMLVAVIKKQCYCHCIAVQLGLYCKCSQVHTVSVARFILSIQLSFYCHYVAVQLGLYCQFSQVHTINVAKILLSLRSNVARFILSVQLGSYYQCS